MGIYCHFSNGCRTFLTADSFQIGSMSGILSGLALSNSPQHFLCTFPKWYMTMELLDLDCSVFSSAREQY